MYSERQLYCCVVKDQRSPFIEKFILAYMARLRPLNHPVRHRSVCPFRIILRMSLS